MKHHWRKLYSLLPASIERKAYKSFFEKEHAQLLANNPAGITSNLTKQQELIKLQRRYSLDTLVETGTFMGDTLFALYPFFKKLYSIELSEHFYKEAAKRFKQYKNINLIQGDSSVELQKLVNQLTTPALFWLDGHYSGGITAKGSKECPVFEELKAVFSSTLKHVIVIDDARLFVGKNDYPTVDEMKAFVSNTKPDYSFSIETDSIRLEPAN